MVNNGTGYDYMKGENNPSKSLKFRENIKKVHLGTKLSKTHKKRISDSEKKHLPKTAFTKGMKPWNYIDGRSKLRGPDKYGDDWDNIRQLVYRRDNFSCQKCHQTMNEQKRAFHVHHKVPFFVSFNNSLENLETLCPSCHRKEEARIMRELKLGGNSGARRKPTN